MAETIFTEVLQIGIDTTKFAQSMKEVEQIYANSIKNMPNLGQVGTASLGPEIKKVAEVFTMAAEQIGRASTSITEDVAIMVQQSEANLAAMASKTKTNVAKINGAMSEGLTFADKFGNALERAFIRVPAMAIASSALLAVTVALGAPIKALVDGFENLGNQTPQFKQVHTELSNMLSLFESIAAKPIFDFILKQMEELAKWLKDNKGYVDQLVTGFGQMAAAFLSTITDFAKLDVVKSGFKGLAEVIIYTVGALNGFINKFSTVIGLVDSIGSSKKDEGDGTIGGFFKAIGHNASNLVNNKEGNSVLDNYQKNEDANAKAMVQALNALNGEGTANIDGSIKSKNELKTSQEIMSDFRVALNEIKERTKDATDSISEQVAKQAINKVTANVKVHAAVEDEKKQIEGLIASYDKLLDTATDLPILGNSSERSKRNRLLLGGTGRSSPFASGDQEEKTAQEAADRETQAAQAKQLADALKNEDASVNARIALEKKAATAGLKYHEDAIRAEMELEEERHNATVFFNKQLPDGALNTPNDLAKKKAAADEEQRHNDALAASKQNLADATRKDTEEERKNALAMDKVNDANRATELQLAKTLGNKQLELQLTKEITDAKIKEAQANRATIAAQMANAPAGSPLIAKLQTELAAAKATIAALQQGRNEQNYSGSALGKLELGDNTGKGASVGDQLKQSLHLDDVAKDWDNATTGLQKFGAGLEAAHNILAGFGTAVTNAVSAYKKGGALGAAGSLLQDSNVTKGLGSLVGMASESMGKMVPIIGPLIGGMFSTITSLFSAGIQAMVQTIHDKIDHINEQAQLGQITLSTQIAELQQEKQDAINQLGGSKKKGAQDELNKILKSLNSEIAQLQKQQKDIINNFNLMVKSLALGSSVMSDWFQTWTQINQQVKQYVDAGGSLVTASQFLNDQLLQQRQKLQDQLNQGAQTAIGDAIQLNQLLTQRIQMLKDEAATEFAMLNADSLERRTSNAVKLGTELQKQRATFAQQLLDTNNQISLENQKVTAEGKIFDINKSIAQLQKDSNALTIASLNEQLAKYTDMQKLIAATNGLVFGTKSIPTAAGATLPIPGEPSVAGPVVGVINITVAPGASIGPRTPADLGNEIARNIRSARYSY